MNRMELVTAKFENGILQIAPHGRIDTNNAEAASKAFSAFCAQYETDQVILDVEDLEYISSAGLRAVLKLRKEKPELKIINAGAEVFEIFDMTGFTEMIPVEKAFRKFSVDGCSILGKGAKGTVYRYNGDTIIKVYNDRNSLPAIRRERELARKAFVLGIPTSISYDVVKVGDKFGSVFEMLDANSYSQMIAAEPENVEKYANGFADLLRQIHETPVKAEDMPPIREDTADRWVKTCEPYLSAEDNAKLQKMLASVPERLFMTHGDYHTNNVMYLPTETMLIDMDTLSHGHPIFELANVFCAYIGFQMISKENVEKFMGFSAEMATKVWELFLKRYFEEKDEAFVKAAEDKIALLGYTRVLHYTLRHVDGDDVKKRVAEEASAKISELLKKVDTLEFE